MKDNSWSLYCVFFIVLSKYKNQFS